MTLRLTTILCALSFIALTANAQMDGNGTYTTTPEKEISKTELPNGQVRIVSTSEMKTIAAQKDNPMNNMDFACSQMVIAAADGTPVNVAGSCYGVDTSGNGMYMWWRADEDKAEECPLGCGTWAIYDGFGKMSEMGARGTFKTNEEGKGTWDGHFMMTGGPDMKMKMKKKGTY